MNRYGQIKDLLLGDLTLSIFIFGCTVTLLVIISLFLSTKEKFDHDKSFLVAFGDQALRATDYSANGESIEASFEIICNSMRNRLS